MWALRRNAEMTWFEEMPERDLLKGDPEAGLEPILSDFPIFHRDHR